MVELEIDFLPRAGENKRQFPVQCLCGRFAKYRGTRHYYNGWFDCECMTVECSRCGTVEIEIGA